MNIISARAFSIYFVPHIFTTTTTTSVRCAYIHKDHKTAHVTTLNFHRRSTQREEHYTPPTNLPMYIVQYAKEMCCTVCTSGPAPKHLKKIYFSNKIILRIMINWYNFRNTFIYNYTVKSPQILAKYYKNKFKIQNTLKY